MNAIKSLLSASSLLLIACTVNADELLRNGDFERGTSGWKGDRKVVEYSGNNKVCEIKVDDDIQSFYQEDLDVKDLKDIVLTFKYKVSSDYKGRGLTMKFIRPDRGFTYRTIDLKGGDKWHTYKWNFGEIRGADEITLEIEILEGEGTILLDDFSVTPK